jgi:hypothetical protein
MRISATGSVGIGTAAPVERLEITGSDATVRVRNTNDAGGGYIQDSFSTLQLGIFNPSATAFGQVPAGGKRSFFGVGYDGRVGSTTNLNVGNPAFRNLLDDGSGNAAIAGNLAANNLPGVEFDVPANPFDDGVAIFVSADQTATIKTITISVPSDGFLVLSGSVLGISRSGTITNAMARLDIFDETSNTTIATSKYSSGAVSTHSIQVVLPVSAGTRTLSLKVKASGNNSGDDYVYYSNTGRFIAMFFPVRY